MIRMKYLVGVGVFLVSCFALLACTSTWRRFRSDDRNSGTIDLPNRTTGRVKWTFPAAVNSDRSAPHLINSAVVDFDDTIFVAGNDLLYVIDPSGKEKCHFTGGGLFDSSPTLAGNSIYVGNNDHNVYSLNKQNCTKNWAFSTDEAVTSSPIVVGNSVVVGSDDSWVYSLSTDEGKVNWRFRSIVGSPFDSSPAYSSAADGLIFIGSEDLNLYAIYFHTGLERWHFHGDTFFTAPPTVASFRGFNIVVAPAYGELDRGKLYAFVAENGQELWEFGIPEGDGIIGSAAVTSDGIVYFGTNEGRLIALGLGEGNLLWEIAPGGPNHISFLASPSVAGNVLYISAGDTFYAVDLTTRTIKWKFSIEDGVFTESPAIGSDGTVYIGASNGVFYAIQ